MRLRLTLDVPRSVNMLYRIGHVTRGGKKVLGQFMTEEGRVYKEAVGWEVRAAIVEQGVEIDPKAYYGYAIAVYFPDAGRDLDNVFKIVQDAIFAAIGVNDNRVIDIHAGKIVDPTHPRAEVLLYTSTPPTIIRQYTKLMEDHHVPALP